MVDEDEAVDGRRCGGSENSTGMKLAGSFPAMMAVMTMSMIDGVWWSGSRAEGWGNGDSSWRGAFKAIDESSNQVMHVAKSSLRCSTRSPNLRSPESTK